MLCGTKTPGAICAITLRITLVAVLTMSLPSIANAAMPMLNSKPVHTSPNSDPDAYRKRHYAWKVARDGKYGRLLFSFDDRPV